MRNDLGGAHIAECVVAGFELTVEIRSRHFRRDRLQTGFLEVCC